MQFAGDIYDEVTAKELAPKKLDSECLGGGRIQHNAEEKKILVYGYSQVISRWEKRRISTWEKFLTACPISPFHFQGFGKADHSVSVDLLKKSFGDYTITWTDEGY